MTLVELLTVTFIISAGFYCGALLGFQFGLFGWILGSALGCSLAILIYRIFVFCLIGREDLDFHYPECKNPVCRSTDKYKVVERTHEGFFVNCACGARYLDKAGRFMIICDNGEKVPYMKRKKVHGASWENDTKDNL